MDRECNDVVALPPELKIDAGEEAASVGEKRPPTPMEEGEGFGVARVTKRLKNGAGEMRQVAEMVLVLSAMGQMRGGRTPTDAEVKLMAGAREKLVEISHNFAPKELVPGHAIGKVIEDLGLNWKLKDQRLGFRGSRLSIKEKVALAKRKMEEPKKFTTPSTHASQTSHPSFAAMGRVPAHTVCSLPLDKSTHVPLPSGTTMVHSPFTHVPATPSAPVTYMQASNVEVKGSAVSVGLPINQALNSSAAAASRGEKTQFIKTEGGSNGNIYTSQANASVTHPLVNAPTWSLQPNSLPSSKMVAESKVPTHTPVKADGIADSGAPRMSLQAARDHTFRPFITQTTSTSVHQPVQTVKSVYSNHNGIAKIVQKLLQPKLPQYPTWIPPSREYMSKALTCQSCSLTVNEVETVAICDACEKGFHLKCLESVSQKGIPRTTEWHCMKCTSLSNGKPFPPKYGRVMRSMTPPKGPASATQGGAQSFSDNKLVNMGQRGNQEKMSSVLQSVTEPGTADCSNLESASGTKISSERGTPRNSITSMGKDTDMAHCAGTLPNDSDSTKPPAPIHDSSSVSLSSDTSSQQIHAAGSVIFDNRLTSEPKCEHVGVSSTHVHDKHESKSQNNMQALDQAEPLNNAEGSSVTCQAGSNVEESREKSGNSSFAIVNNVKQSAEGDVQEPPSLDDKQTKDGFANAPSSRHDANQSDQGVIHSNCASKHNTNQHEQGVDHAPALKDNIQQSEQVVAHATYALEDNVDQSELVVACTPASVHNVEQGISHTPFASEQYVKQIEQGVGHGPSVSDDNVKKSEQDVICPPSDQNQLGVAHPHSASESEQVVTCAPSDAEHKVEQSDEDVTCAPSASEQHNEQNEQGFVHAPSVSEHNIEQTEQVVHAPFASGHNVEQSEEDASSVPSDPERCIEQNEQGFSHAPSVSGHSVEQSEEDASSVPSDPERCIEQNEQGFSHAPSVSGHSVEQSEEDASSVPSDPERCIEQNEQGFSHAPSVSGHNVEQSELDVACAPCESEHNIEQSEQGVACAPSASDHYVVQSEQEVACPPSDSEHNVEQNQQGLTYAPASDHNVEQSEQVVVCAPSDAENSVEQSKQGVNNAPLASECSVKQNVAHPHLTKNPEPVDSVSNNMQLSSEAYHTVEWVRNAFKVVDGKAFYESCCVGGVMYQVMDHALFCSSHGKLIPFKLQTMWEDVKTGSKWVTVSRYYLREDLPEDVGQPFSPESNEVYDSNHETSVMAGSIQGSCKVLPPVKYKEETERRSQIESGTKNNSEPVFLCKYVHSCHHTNLLVVLVS
ncbi:PHD finger protein At3g20280 [Linum perenne]